MKAAASIHHIHAALLQRIRFGLLPFRSPLLRESRLISPPHPTQMLHFGWFALPRLRRGVSLRTGFLFGNRWIKGRMRLPSAYRSLPRPSSLLEPSHPPSGVLAPAALKLALQGRLGALGYWKWQAEQLAEACCVHLHPINAIFFGHPCP